MIAFRIADVRYPIFDGAGAKLHGGRWNSIGTEAIYASETFAGALLEILAHANLSKPPKNHRVVRILIPDGIAVETLLPDHVTGWDAADSTAPRIFGDQWLRQKRSAVLRVPSVVTQGRENNLILNPRHPEFALIRVGEPEPVRWDERLFR